MEHSEMSILLRADIRRNKVLFIMGPHTNNFNRLDIIQDLVNNSMLDINPSRTSTS